jgi:hypothetical protein
MADRSHVTFADAAFCSVTALVTALVFWPTLSNGFVNWDDPGMVLRNPHITRFSAQNVRWMATTFHMGPYQPLTWFSLALDHTIWGLDPYGYHLTSLLWHIANALSLFVLARTLYSRFASESVHATTIGLCATLAALLFAVHPLRVQPVAWVSDRLDLMAAFFGIWTVWAYVRGVPIDRFAELSKGYLSISLLAFVASLLCKSSTALLPAVLIALDAYPFRRLSFSRGDGKRLGNRRVWIEKWPYWLIGVIASVVAVVGRASAGSLAPVSAYGPIDRVAIACYNAVFYLWKTIVPTQLSPLYELPDQIDPWAAPFVGSAIIVVVVTALLLSQWRRVPAAAVVWVIYAILILPVSGLFQTGAQLAADRYSYIPSLALSVFFGGVLLIRSVRTMALVSSPICIAALGVMSWRQCSVWRDSETLWTHALRIDSQSCTAHTNLACSLIDNDQLEPARELLERAVQIRPRSHSAHSNLGAVLSRQGENGLALQHYLEASKWSPPSA